MSKINVIIQWECFYLDGLQTQSKSVKSCLKPTHMCTSYLVVLFIKTPEWLFLIKIKHFCVYNYIHEDGLTRSLLII